MLGDRANDRDFESESEEFAHRIREEAAADGTLDAARLAAAKAVEALDEEPGFRIREVTIDDIRLLIRIYVGGDVDGEEAREALLHHVDVETRMPTTSDATTSIEDNEVRYKWFHDYMDELGLERTDWNEFAP